MIVDFVIVIDIHHEAHAVEADPVHQDQVEQTGIDILSTEIPHPSLTIPPGGPPVRTGPSGEAIVHGRERIGIGS